MIVGFIIGAAIVSIAILAILSVRTDDPDKHCISDVPCQECGMCYEDHFNARLVGTHSYRFPRDFYR